MRTHSDIRVMKGDAPSDADQPEWLETIWAVNEAIPGTFLKPEISDWWAGGMVEEYPTARVIFNSGEEGDVRVVGKTEAVELALEAAERKLRPRTYRRTNWEVR